MLLPFSAAPGITKAVADARFVLKAGDTMTGPLTINTAVNSSAGGSNGLKLTDGSKTAQIWQRITGRIALIPDVSVTTNYLDILNNGTQLVYEFHAAGGAYFSAYQTSIIFNTNTSGDIYFQPATSNTFFSANVNPNINATYALGTSSLYWTNLYSQKVSFNSTASLDGATAGKMSVTGVFGGFTMIDNLVISGSNKQARFTNTDSPGLTATQMSDVGGQILNFGVNYAQSGATNTAYPGGFFRIDTRTGSIDQLFSVTFQTIPDFSGETQVFKVSTTGDVVATGNYTVADAKNIILNTTTGTKIGTSTSQKLGFFNATPVVQQTGDIGTALSNLGLITSPTITSSPGLLSTTTGINAKTTGQTTIYTVPAGKTAIITQVIVRCTAASSITNGPTASVGYTSAAYTDIYAATNIAGLTATTAIFGYSTVGMSKNAVAATVIKLNISTASTGTSQTVAVDVIGYIF